MELDPLEYSAEMTCHCFVFVVAIVVFELVQLDQGVHDSSTFWEQIDSGMHFTPTKKFLTAVPMLLYMLVLLTSRPSPMCWVISTIATIILIVAKVPMMHGVRIFGINKGSA